MFVEAARISSKHFTRQRTLALPTVVSFLLSGVQGAVQSELYQLFAHRRNRADSVREVTAEAFYQARYKISALVFGEVCPEIDAEHLIYESVKPGPGGSVRAMPAPLELIQRLPELIPPSRRDRHRYCEVLAPNTFPRS